MNWPWKKEPAQPAVPTQPPLIMTKVEWEDTKKEHVFHLTCRLCGRKWSEYESYSRNHGTVCAFCGATASIDEVRTYMRFKLASAHSKTCIHCYRDETEHANDKCLFMETAYTPRGDVP
jgi:hypothetical protein